MERFVDFTSEVITGYSAIAADIITEATDSLVSQLENYGRKP
jgi:hypothetical protein